MKKILLLLGISILFLSMGSCGSDSTTENDDQDDQDDDVSPGLQFDTVADFSSSASAALSTLIQKTTTGVCEDLEEPIGMDGPDLADGLDCDEDGGVVAHATPSQYSLALKRVTMLSEDSADINLLADTGTLATSQVITFTTDDTNQTIINIDSEDLVAGTYTGLEFELYYFQLTFDVGGTEKNVRFYMSDDDFDAEGNLGHHQGDVTFVDDDGVELGWINGTWSEVSSSRDVQAGAGGIDPETGHVRGFFGNSDQWNATEQMQGPEQDIFVYDLPFSSSLVIPEPAENDEFTTVTATFSVADTFFYEDFDNPTLENCTGFCPEEGGEAGLGNAEWAPLVPTATLTTETISAEQLNGSCDVQCATSNATTNFFGVIGAYIITDPALANVDSCMITFSYSSYGGGSQDTYTLPTIGLPSFCDVVSVGGGKFAIACSAQNIGSATAYDVDIDCSQVNDGSGAKDYGTASVEFCTRSTQ